MQDEYDRKISVNYQGDNSLKTGNELEVTTWIGREGEGLSDLRVVKMTDLTAGKSYSSSLANLMMRVRKVDVTVRGRIVGNIEQGTGSTTFDLEMTAEEYQKYYPHREAEYNQF